MEIPKPGSLVLAVTAAWLAYLTANAGCTTHAVNLADMQKTAARLRARAEPWPSERTPEFTQLKRELRDWVESRISVLGPSEDPEPLACSLNDELEGAGLTGVCDQHPQVEADSFENYTIGDIGAVEIQLLEPGWLVVDASLGVPCGADHSVYLYQGVEGRWVRRVESERNDYVPPDGSSVYDHEQPEHTILSDAAADSSRLFLTVGILPWCTSNWHPIFYRLRRMEPGLAAAKRLIDGSQFAYAFYNWPIPASLGMGDLHLEFSVSSLDSDIATRNRVLHFVIEEDRVRRVDPIARGQRAFVEEWLSLPWDEAAQWTDPEAREILRSWHERKDAREWLRSSVADQACDGSTDRWQVQSSDGREGHRVFYFLVWDLGSDGYRMLDASDTSFPGCPIAGD